MNILGTEYELITDESILKVDASGICKPYNQVIYIAPVESMLTEGDSTKIKKKRYDEVLRHEIVHAFFVESGLCNYTDDEELVDWIAVQFPKMLKVFKETNCI